MSGVCARLTRCEDSEISDGWHMLHCCRVKGAMVCRITMPHSKGSCDTMSYACAKSSLSDTFCNIAAIQIHRLCGGEYRVIGVSGGFPFIIVNEAGFCNKVDKYALQPKRKAIRLSRVSSCIGQYRPCDYGDLPFGWP